MKRRGYGKKGGFKDHHERAGTTRRAKYRSRDKFGTNNIPDCGGLKRTCPSGVSIDAKKEAK